MSKEYSLADKILLTVKEMADVVYDGLPKSEQFSKHIDGYTNHTIACTLNRLKREGLLEEVKIDEKIVFKLTNKGKLKIFFSYVNKKHRWDNKWRIIIFDIPEPKKKQRELFRSKIKELGFKKVQNSVWISPLDSQGAVKLLTESYGLDEYVRFALVEHISGERDLIKSFNLNV